MWVEAILSETDLVALVAEFTPVRILLAKDGDFSVGEASSVTLVPDLGLRFTCKAKLHWPVLGIPVPITLHSLTAVLVPTISKRPNGNVLVFKLQVEHADFAAMPTFIDSRITDKINKELATEQAELAWDFTKTLTHAFALPGTLQPLDAFALQVAWGEVRVTAEAMVLAVSFHPHITRRGTAIEAKEVIAKDVAPVVVPDKAAPSAVSSTPEA